MANIIREVESVAKHLGADKERRYGIHVQSANEIPVSCAMAPQYGQDVVQYTFDNSACTEPVACVLYRGVTGLAPAYFFGNAFGQGVYVPMGIASYYNSLTLDAPTPANENANYALASLNTGGSQLLTCFIFIVPAGGKIQALEGGIPSCSMLVDVHAYVVTLSAQGAYCETYSQAAVLQYESQTGIPVPPQTDPYQVDTVLMTTIEPNTPTNEIIPGQYATSGPCPSGGGQSCQQMIDQGIADNNIQEVLAGIECLIENQFLSAFSVIETAVRSVKKKL